LRHLVFVCLFILYYFVLFPCFFLSFLILSFFFSFSLSLSLSLSFKHSTQTASLSISEQTKCEFSPQTNNQYLVYTDKVIDAFSDVTCKQACSQERDFNCRSYSFLSEVISSRYFNYQLYRVCQGFIDKKY
jgi:hypothetical protein